MGAAGILIGTTTLLGVGFALHGLLTTFRVYDDEGYFLLAIKHYLSEGRLYTGTYAQYGPFYYFAQAVFFRLLHFPINHDGGRLVTLIYWLGAGFFAALLVSKLSKSLLLGCASGLGCVLVASVLANEPGHPQQVVLLLWIAASYLSVAEPDEGIVWRLFLLGAIGGALVFTKINIGVFYVAALAHAVFCLIRPGWIRSLSVGLTIIYAIVGPWFIMHSDWHKGSRTYDLPLVVLCGTSTFVLGSLLRTAWDTLVVPLSRVLDRARGRLIGKTIVCVWAHAGKLPEGCA